MPKCPKCGSDSVYSIKPAYDDTSLDNVGCGIGLFHNVWCWILELLIGIWSLIAWWKAKREQPKWKCGACKTRW